MEILNTIKAKLDKKLLRKIVIRVVVFIYTLYISSVVTDYSSNILLPDLFDNERVTVNALLFISVVFIGIYLFFKEKNVIKYLFVFHFTMIFIVFTTLISYDKRPIILLPLLLSLFYDKTTGLVGALAICGYNVFTLVDRPDFLSNGPEFMIVIIMLILAGVSAVIINKKIYYELPCYIGLYLLSVWLYEQFGSYCEDYPGCELYCDNDFKYMASKGLLVSIGIFLVIRVAYYLYINNFVLKRKLKEIISSDYVLVKEMKKNSLILYNHSIEIAELSEKAAVRIKANADIAFAGGLYHDVGKLASSNYIHEGIKIANKYKMPFQVKQIIMEHNVKNRLPKSKEAAIVMLADTAVSAVEYLRSNNKKSVDEVAVFENAMMTRMKNGALNESTLTIDEFIKIKEVFIQYKELETNKGEK